MIRVEWILQHAVIDIAVRSHERTRAAIIGNVGVVRGVVRVLQTDLRNGRERAAVHGDEIARAIAAGADGEVECLVIVAQRGRAVVRHLRHRGIARRGRGADPRTRAVLRDARKPALQRGACRARDDEAEEDVPVAIRGDGRVDLHVRVEGRAVRRVVRETVEGDASARGWRNRRAVRRVAEHHRAARGGIVEAVLRRQRHAERWHPAM